MYLGFYLLQLLYIALRKVGTNKAQTVYILASAPTAYILASG